LVQTVYASLEQTAIHLRARLDEEVQRHDANQARNPSAEAPNTIVSRRALATVLRRKMKKADLAERRGRVFLGGISFSDC
jgi:hypothetical protein